MKNKKIILIIVVVLIIFLALFFMYSYMSSHLFSKDENNNKVEDKMKVINAIKSIEDKEQRANIIQSLINQNFINTTEANELY